MKEHIDTTYGTVSIDGVDIDGISPGSLPFPEPKRDTKDVTTLKDDVKRKGLKILDPGDTKFSGIYIPGDSGQMALLEASDDMQEHTFQIVIPEAALVFEYQAYVSSDYPSEEDENTLSFNVKLEVTGGFVRSATYAGILKIEGAGAGITYFPSNACTSLLSSDDCVIFHEATGITSDTIKVTADGSSYIGISYDRGRTWTKLTSGTASSFQAGTFPLAGGMSRMILKVMSDNKATRFMKLIVARAAA